MGNISASIAAAFFLTCTAPCLVSAADNTIEDGAIAKILSSNESSDLNVEKIVAEKFSERLKFLDLSYVKPDEDGKNSGWNAKYNLKYGTTGGSGFGYRSGRAVLESFAAELDINGSYSYGDAANTDDLSKVNFSLAYLTGDVGKVNPVSKPDSIDYQNCVAAIDVAAPDFKDKNIDCWKDHRIDKLDIDKSTSYMMSFDVHLSVEGNQNYSNANTAYGVQGLISASGYPSVRLDIERVDASDNEFRREFTRDDEFDRVSAEIGYGYVFRASDDRPISLYLSYRHFHEISAPDEIKDDDLDSFGYAAISLRFPAALFGLVEKEDFNLFIRYTEGQLPFDREDDEAIEFGFTTNIAVLGDLLK